MDRILRILFALLVVIGTTAAEVRLPEAVGMDCCAQEGLACNCGMPMPQRDSQPCSSSAPSPVAVPTRTVTAVAESAAAAEQILPEPKPWFAAWSLSPRFGDEAWKVTGPISVDTGPPPLASERSARLGVFRI